MELNHGRKAVQYFIGSPSHHEWTAFMLQPNDQESTFGGYFGPQRTQVDKQGTPYYTPAKEDITPEAVLYWEHRYKVATNALMRMRYAALAWDFKPLK